MSVDTAAGRVEVVVNNNVSDFQTTDHDITLGEVDGLYSIRIDDEPRVRTVHPTRHHMPDGDR